MHAASMLLSTNTEPFNVKRKKGSPASGRDCKRLFQQIYQQQQVHQQRWVNEELSPRFHSAYALPLSVRCSGQLLRLYVGSGSGCPRGGV